MIFLSASASNLDWGIQSKDASSNSMWALYAILLFGLYFGFNFVLTLTFKALRGNDDDPVHFYMNVYK